MSTNTNEKDNFFNILVRKEYNFLINEIIHLRPNLYSEQRVLEYALDRLYDVHY